MAKLQANTKNLKLDCMNLSSRYAPFPRHGEFDEIDPYDGLIRNHTLN